MQMGVMAEIEKALELFGEPIDRLTAAVAKLPSVEVRGACDKKIQEIMGLLIDLEYEAGRSRPDTTI
jgi:predicted sugar kinase